MFIVLFSAKNNKRLQKHINSFINTIQILKYQKGINDLYCGSGIVKTKTIDTPKKLNKVLKTLTYNVNCSIHLQKDFVELKINTLTQEEFQNYKEYVNSYQAFKLALKAQDITTQKIPIKSYISNRKIIDYVFPVVNGILNKDMISILKNKYNRNLLINTHANMVTKQNYSKALPLLIDVYSQWLEQNIDKISLKKVIYVISFVHYEDLSNICNLIAKFLSKGLLLAIRLKSFDENKTTLLKKLKPQFIVIDGEMSIKKDVNTYFQLLSIKKFASSLGIKMIYENPIHYDGEQAKKLGLEYYYNF